MMKAKKGFTLVEILIVVVILGILAAIVIPQFTNASEEARQNNLKANLQTLRSQIELYKIDNFGTAPDPLGDLAPLVGKKYMDSVPLNPYTGGRDTAVGPGAAWDYDPNDGEIHPGDADGIALEAGW